MTTFCILCTTLYVVVSRNKFASCKSSAGVAGYPGVPGGPGLPGVMGAIGATGATGIQVKTIQRRVIRSAGCPGKSQIHNIIPLK